MLASIKNQFSQKESYSQYIFQNNSQKLFKEIQEKPNILKKFFSFLFDILSTAECSQIHGQALRALSGLISVYGPPAIMFMSISPSTLAKNIAAHPQLTYEILVRCLSVFNEETNFALMPGLCHLYQSLTKSNRIILIAQSNVQLTYFIAKWVQGNSLIRMVQSGCNEIQSIGKIEKFLSEIDWKQLSQIETCALKNFLASLELLLEKSKRNLQSLSTQIANPPISKPQLINQSQSKEQPKAPSPKPNVQKIPIVNKAMPSPQKSNPQTNPSLQKDAPKPQDLNRPAYVKQTHNGVYSGYLNTNPRGNKPLYPHRDDDQNAPSESSADKEPMSSPVQTAPLGDLKDRTSLFENEKLWTNRGPNTEFQMVSLPLTKDQRITLRNTICAFLNGNGGRIYLGVSTDRKVLGLSLNSKNRDNFKLFLQNDIQVNPFYPCILTEELIEIKFLPLKDKQSNQIIPGKGVIKVIVRPGDQGRLYSVQKENYECYLRVKNANILLKPREVYEEINSRISKVKNSRPLIDDFLDREPETLIDLVL